MNRSQLSAAAGAAAASSAGIATLVEELEPMLCRLRLTAIRDQLDNLLEEASRQELNLREALAWLCV